MNKSTRLRLFLSYQRYAFLLTLLLALLTGISIYLFQVTVHWHPFLRWILMAGLVIAGIAPLRFAIYIYRSFPKKLRATQIAAIRISQGRFNPQSVQRYCEDPCFKVVAKEILRMSGLPKAQVTKLIANYVSQSKEPKIFVRVTNKADQPIQLGGQLISQRTQQPNRN